MSAGSPARTPAAQTPPTGRGSHPAPTGRPATFTGRFSRGVGWAISQTGRRENDTGHRSIHLRCGARLPNLLRRSPSGLRNHSSPAHDADQLRLPFRAHGHGFSDGGGDDETAAAATRARPVERQAPPPTLALETTRQPGRGAVPAGPSPFQRAHGPNTAPTRTTVTPEGLPTPGEPLRPASVRVLACTWQVAWHPN
jgi:hypothetical protein